jgi:hypothetical protein
MPVFAAHGMHNWIEWYLSELNDEAQYSYRKR